MAPSPPPEWIHLGPDERIVWRGRPSVYTILDDLLSAVALALVGVAAVAALNTVALGPGVPPWVTLAPLALVPVGLAVGAAAYVHWRGLHYVITTREVYRKRGVLSRDVTRIPVDRVQNTAYSQSALQRLLSYGDVTLHTAGSGAVDLVLRDVPNPETVSRVLSEQLDAASSRASASAERS